MNLSAVDLNLLVALDALLVERSVTAAGARLHLTQSTMSHALRRLRELFGDPLLVRKSAGMTPTALGLTLAPKVRRILEEIEGTLSERRRFDPSRDRHTFTIAINDYAAWVIAPRVAAQAPPNITLRFRTYGAALPAQALASGEIDAAIGTFLEHAEPISEELLFRERFVCLARRDHPRLTGGLDLEAFLELGQVLISSPGEGPGVVDAALARIGRTRRVAVMIPYFLAAPAIVAESDYLITIAERIADRLAPLLGLTIYPPPIELPGFALTLAWPARLERDPASRWLRSAIKTARKR